MNDTGVRPIRDQVLLRRVAPTLMSGGIHLVEEEWPNIGTVLAVGPGVKAPELVAGVRVMFHSRPARALIPDTREPNQRKEWVRVVMLAEEDIMAIVEDP